MKKKIYTFIVILFVILLLVYFLWAIAANIQKEALKRHLSNEWSLNLIDENIKTDGFPFKFVLKVAKFQSPLNNTPLTLKFSELEMVKLIYNFSDLILFVEKPMITHLDYPKFNSSSVKLEASISDRPFSGRFKLITEQEDWQIADDRNFKIFEAKNVLFALKDTDEMKLDFYFQANDLNFSFLEKIKGKDAESPNKLILKGAILNSFINNREKYNQKIKVETIMLEQLEVDIGFFKLNCDDVVTISLLTLTSEGDFGCLLKLSSKDISKIKTDNRSILSIIDFFRLLLIINNSTMTDETQAMSIKFNLNRGLFYLNAIPIYQFPTKY